MRGDEGVEVTVVGVRKKIRGVFEELCLIIVDEEYMD